MALLLITPSLYIPVVIRSPQSVVQLVFVTTSAYAAHLYATFGGLIRLDVRLRLGSAAYILSLEVYVIRPCLLAVWLTPAFRSFPFPFATCVMMAFPI